LQLLQPGSSIPRLTRSSFVLNLAGATPASTPAMRRRNAAGMRIQVA
jgi:hypothetical protein